MTYPSCILSTLWENSMCMAEMGKYLCSPEQNGFLLKITKTLQDKLEEIFRIGEYHIRYEKGNFKGGFCILEQNKVIVINRFYPLETKINTLMDVLRQVEIPMEQLSPSQLSLVHSARDLVVTK